MTGRQRTSTAVRFDPEVHAALVEAAADRDVSVNWLVNRAVRAFLAGLVPVADLVVSTAEQATPAATGGSAGGHAPAPRVPALQGKSLVRDARMTEFLRMVTDARAVPTPALLTWWVDYVSGLSDVRPESV